MYGDIPYFAPEINAVKLLQAIIVPTISKMCKPDQRGSLPNSSWHNIIIHVFMYSEDAVFYHPNFSEVLSGYFLA